MKRRQGGLNTGASGYTVFTADWAVRFKDGNYIATCSINTDTQNVSGDTLKILNRYVSSIRLNYTHTGSIAQNWLEYSVIGIGRKPTSA